MDRGRPRRTNALGQPTGYALLPGENAKPFAAADSWVRKRAGFLDAHVWVTPFDAADEITPAAIIRTRATAATGWRSGPQPTGRSTTGTWCCGTTSAITHNPRPEDWPVMPVYEAGFKLVPVGLLSPEIRRWIYRYVKPYPNVCRIH